MNLKHVYYRVYQAGFKLVMGTNLFNWKEPELLEGAGSIRRLPEFVKSKGLDNVLIVTDSVLNQKLHVLDSLYEEMDKAGVSYAVFDGVQPNPTIQNIEAAKEAYVNHNCKGIIAFGGGSPMDCAKAAGAIVTNNKPVSKMTGLLKVRHKLPPLFAVPTTAGTGSEVTLAAVVSDEATHKKLPMNDPKLRAKYAVLDPELTVGLPPHITSTTGMDALTHAVEAYIGRSNVANTEDYAKKAVKLIFDNIETAYADGKNIEARGAMLKASYYAGMAFTRAYVGYVHAIGHQLGGYYHVPHGLAMATILPHVLDYYGETAYKRLADLAEVAGVKTTGTDEEKAKAFIAEVRAMNERMGIGTGFDCIKDEDIDTIAKRALKEGNPLYPVPKIMEQADCVALIKELKN
ncbi:MAG: iron-containing alcohol dehydrogenase [Clostridia bacterium]|nr:iron-containing alcohol dehydrogenase [Clostridia bacterium]